MLPIRGLYEVAIRVKDLSKSEAFYREILGLEVGIRDERRNMLFLRAGGQAGMVVLQEDKGIWPTQHFAFKVEENGYCGGNGAPHEARCCCRGARVPRVDAGEVRVLLRPGRS